MKQEDLETIILDIIENNPQTKAQFDAVRRKTCSRLRINQPANRLLLQAYQNLVKKKRIKPNLALRQFVVKAGIRSQSGIAVITSLLKPYACPGECVYCPTEARMPKSYLSSEPAAARSLALNFHPYPLMQKRIEMLEANGHPTDKIEYITKGGTWNAYPLVYQYWYILESFRACNNLSRRKPTAQTTEEDWCNKPLSAIQDAMEKEQRYNEGAKHRIIGLTLETRPDAVTPKTISHMRKQGCTRIELGLQAPDDKILSLVKRGHNVDEFRRAMYLLREAGFKVDLHFMPDLPGTTPAHDVEMYKLLFEDPALKPDMVKIYPNTVIETAELAEWFKDGRYTPYGDKELFNALIEMKKATPRYCRISRLIRDIPTPDIQAGNSITNLREALHKKMIEQGNTCACLRCREIGRQQTQLKGDKRTEIFVDTYKTSGGTEHFITVEDPNRIAVYGFLRLRIPHEHNIESWMRKNETDILQKTIPEIKDCAFVRELHVYGQLVKIGKTDHGASQHKGLGTQLMIKAEELVKKEAKQSKIAVISGVGVRGYYRKLGYRKIGTYMVKNI
ncbi:tRNA uridine(34) 5-carboxymethylaminomethyl modification radical SAM/GNAT enzyme Elp3 [Patescibacteria group bacterium]|nr:tRNA uridine(34) 5-carboxymethylaminomethyl modification radical SAM/GNAT enzyme Elp3 [Patescibacteria group bacterium]MBU1721761.1 tRNA uridine(34) 5-carboxymethylaminomethyl modification radical SAM/GNAT enzyme Elp3 [Patescibacteria group bacterium]MBU1901400.1 tRNA uridine(34) 5-carboxymethylaminomethyl modification radical SAM/GNAT enzyme Elp3 [Patescibacteria group bacterium]